MRRLVIKLQVCLVTNLQVQITVLQVEAHHVHLLVLSFKSLPTSVWGSQDYCRGIYTKFFIHFDLLNFEHTKCYRNSSIALLSDLKQ